MRQALFGQEAFYDNETDTVCDRWNILSLQPIHTLFTLGQYGPCGVNSIMPLVLFTFNVTETENTTQQPFITKAWEIEGHTSLSILFTSLSSSIVSPSIHLSIVLLSVLRGYIILSSHMAHSSFLYPHNPPLLSVSIFHHNSLKGGISKSTNGRDLIGKCYRGGGAVYCLL